MCAPHPYPPTLSLSLLACGGTHALSHAPLLPRAAPQDLVITSTAGMIISLFGTILMCTLFVFEVNAYLSVGSSTTLVVDELVDEVLRANFNVTLHQVRNPGLATCNPCPSTCNLQLVGANFTVTRCTRCRAST